MVKSETVSELQRLLSNPKVTFEKGLLNTDNDIYNGFVSSMKNMEINRKSGAGAVSKRKGTASISNFNDSRKWLLLEKIDVSGCAMHLGIDSKRGVYVHVPSFPFRTIPIYREGPVPYFTSDNTTFSYKMTFATGSRFWLLDNGSYYYLVADTGEAYRMDKRGLVKFAQPIYANKATVPTTPVLDLQYRSLLNNEIACYLDIVRATNKELDKLYVVDARRTNELQQFSGIVRGATVNDANVISTFTDPLPIDGNRYVNFSSLPAFNARFSKVTLDDTAPADSVLLRRTGSEEYTFSDFTASTTAPITAYLMYAVPASYLSGYGGDNANLLTAPVGDYQLLSRKLYIVIPRPFSNKQYALSASSDTLDEYMQIENIKLVTPYISGTPTNDETRIGQQFEKSALGDITTFITGEADVAWVTTFNPYSTDYNGLIPILDFGTQTSSSDFSYFWQTYELETTDAVKNLIESKYQRNFGEVRINEYTTAPTVSTTHFAYTGVLMEATVELEYGADNIAYKKAPTAIVVDDLVLGSGSDVSIVAANHYYADHWNFTEGGFLSWLTGGDPVSGGTEAIDPTTLEYNLSIESDAFLQVKDAFHIKNAMLQDRIAIWNNDEIICVSQKGYGQSNPSTNSNSYTFTYSATVEDTVDGNVNLMQGGKEMDTGLGSIKIFPLRRIVSPITKPIYTSLRSFPYTISEFTTAISAAEHMVFNGKTLFVVQGGRLWIGDYTLLLKQPVEIDSTINHMVRFHNGVLLFTDRGILRVDPKGNTFATQNYSARQVVSSGFDVFFINENNDIMRGKLMFSENNVPFVQYDKISFTVSNLTLGDRPIMHYFDNQLYVCDGLNIYRYNNEIGAWDKHITVGNQIDMLSDFDGKLIMSILEEPSRANLFDPAELLSGGGDE